MKKLTILAAMLACFMAANAQNIIPVYNQELYGMEPQAANLYLESEKTLCELKEVVNVHIRMTLADKDAIPHFFEYSFNNPFDAPWVIGDFKIISGGAAVIITEKNIAQLQMPATMPKDKMVVVQVTLKPVAKNYAQVILFTTIYLEDNDNVFTFNCPYMGITNEKYVIKSNGGALTGSDAAAKKALNNKDAAGAKKLAQYYSLKAASADVAATQAGFNLSVLTGNAKAVYVKEEDVTTVMLNDSLVEMSDGKKATGKRMYSIVLSFPGRAAGTFKIKSGRQISASISLPQFMYYPTCTCTDDPADASYASSDPPPHPECAGGDIIITRYDGKVVEGHVNAHLQDADALTGTKFFATLHGKFKVPVANQ